MTRAVSSLADAMCAAKDRELLSRQPGGGRPVKCKIEMSGVVLMMAEKAYI